MMRIEPRRTIIWKRTRIEKVADQHGGRVAPGIVGGFLPRAHVRFVDPRRHAATSRYA